MNDLAILTKQEVMRLFNIRDRTFYSWIEKEIINPIEEIDGQKKYDIGKALKMKNISLSDVTSLLATPANIAPEEEEEENNYLGEKSQASQEMISNLKNQLDALKAELSDERNKSLTLISKMGVFENQQKLLGEIRANESQLMELAKKRENDLMAVFQERMKEVIVLSQENGNQQYDKILESVKQVQTERERSLKGLVKMSFLYMSVFFIFVILAFASVYIFQTNRIDELKNEKAGIITQSTQAEDKLKSELKASADRIQMELKANTEQILALQAKNDLEKKNLEDNLQKRIEAEKLTLTNFYTQNIKAIQGQLDLISKEKNNIKDDKDELRVQIQILEIKFKSVLDELLSEKKNNTVAVKEQEGLRKSLMEINESLNKLREKSAHTTPVPTPKPEPTPTPLIEKTEPQ